MTLDWGNIIVAVLALIGTLFGSMTANSKTTALISYRIQKLEEQVSKHNSIVERTYKLEKDLSTAFVKLDGLREEIHKIEEDNSK